MGGSLVAPVMIFFEWVCSGGFQIGGVGFKSVAWVVGVVPVVGSSLMVCVLCGSVDGSVCVIL